MDKIKKTENSAEELFKKGLNCSECVVLAYLNNFDTGFGEEILALSSGFGGGIGHTEGTCGAVTGAVLALGIKWGRRDPIAIEDGLSSGNKLKTIYPIFAALVKEAEEKFGSVCCAQLKAPYKDDPDSRLRKKNCQKIIAHCAGLAAKYSEASIIKELGELHENF